MRWEQIERSWPQFGDRLKARWKDLSDADLAVINGRRELLQRELRAKYGFSEEQADREIDAFSGSCKWGRERFEHCLELLFETKA